MCIYCGIETDYSPNACESCIAYSVMRSIELSMWNHDERVLSAHMHATRRAPWDFDMEDLAHIVQSRHDDMPDDYVQTDGLADVRTMRPDLDAWCMVAP